MIANTTTRVEKHTSTNINEKIRKEMEKRLELYKNADPQLLDQRLEELDQEWDIERTLETNGSVLLLASMALGLIVNRRFLILPILIGGFCLQHALSGWCPPIEVFRRMGVRTAREIDEERVALKALRGDFSRLPQDKVEIKLSDVLDVVRKPKR